MDTGTCRARSTSVASDRWASRTSARGPSTLATWRRGACDRTRPSAAQHGCDALGDRVGIADAVDALQDPLVEVERDDGRGLGVILLDPRAHRLDGVVLAVDQPAHDLGGR